MIASQQGSWPEVLLESVVNLITYGFTNPMPTTDAGPFMVTAKDIRHGRVDYASARHTSMDAYETKLTPKSRPEVGDVLLTKDGSIGRVAVCDRDHICINQSVALLRPSSLITPQYLAYLLQAPKYQEQMERDSGGSTIRHIYISRVGKMAITLPSLDEQRAISDVLGALDDKIASNLELAEAADLYLRAEFRRAVDDRAQRVPLFDVLEVDFGEAFKGTEFSEHGEGRPLIRIRDLKSLAPQVWTTEQRPREVVVQPGDILIGMDAEFRAIAWLGEPGLLNQRVCRARSIAFGQAYLREALRAPLASRENEKSATTVIHLNKGDLERTEIIVPAPDRLAIFEEVAEPVFAHRVAIAQESRSLAKLRDALLPELIAGRLRVKDSEKKIEEVV